MRDVDELFAALSRSSFRTRFKLAPDDQRYVSKRSRATLRSHAQRIVNERLAPAELTSDGRQTPMRGHPVFVAQHATATCCRKCLAKWHGIEAGRQLNAEEVDYLVHVIDHWIKLQLPSEDGHPPDSQQMLFPI